MNVHPGITTHAKFRLFRLALGRADALEFLLRLWGHCQTKKLGENWGPVSADYVEATCGWDGERGKLFSALLQDFCGKDGWVKVNKAGNLIVCGWNEHNTALLNSWKSGRLGGRPRGQNGLSQPKPTANRRQTHGLSQPKPTENPTGLDWTGRDGTGLDVNQNSLSLRGSESEGGAESGAGKKGADRSAAELVRDEVQNGTTGRGALSAGIVPTGTRNDSVAEWPTRGEWLGYCGMVGLPEWLAVREWERQEAARPPWGKVGNWQKHAAFKRTLWEQDGRPGPAGGGAGRDKKGAGESASQAAYVRKESVAELERQIAEHAANENSTAFNPGHSKAEGQDLRDKKARLKKLKDGGEA